MILPLNLSLVLLSTIVDHPKRGSDEDEITHMAILTLGLMGSTPN